MYLLEQFDTAKFATSSSLLFWQRILLTATLLSPLFTTAHKSDHIKNTKCDYKGKRHPITCHEGTNERHRYSYTLSLTSELIGGGWSTSRPSPTSPGESPGTVPNVPVRYPMYSSLFGPHGRSWQARKISLRVVFDPRTAQPVASHYTGRTGCKCDVHGSLKFSQYTRTRI